MLIADVVIVLLAPPPNCFGDGIDLFILQTEKHQKRHRFAPKLGGSAPKLSSGHRRAYATEIDDDILSLVSCSFNSGCDAAQTLPTP
jgi:hypothetical protein